MESVWRRLSCSLKCQSHAVMMETASCTRRPAIVLAPAIIFSSRIPSTSTLFFFFLNDTPPPEIYPLPLPAALPIPTTDTAPLDLKRVTAKVTYFARGRTHEVLEAETFGSAGEQLGLSASELKLASTEPATTIEKPTEPTITSSLAKLTFSVTAPEGSTAIVWSVDGVAQSTPEAVKSGATKWSFSWTISGLS